MAVRGESRKADLYGATIPLTVVANLVVIGRLFARRASAASLWWDDYLIGIALVSLSRPQVYSEANGRLMLKVPNWGISICYWIQNIGGLDRHTIAANGPIGPEQLTKFFKVCMSTRSLVCR